MDSQPTTTRRLPREIAPNIVWMGACQELSSGLIHIDQAGDYWHSHGSIYLLKGSEHTLLVDTSSPNRWPVLEQQLDEVLGDRGLDFIAPTHPEPAHVGNLFRLLQRYPEARVIGDLRDYHLFFPRYADRFDTLPAGTRIPLGGLEFELLPGPIKDLVSTQWGYESTNQVIFVGDGFAYVHPRPEGVESEAAIHAVGECAMLTTELPIKPQVEHAVFITQAALWWARYLDAGPIFQEALDIIADHPARIVAPAHGNVITNFDAVLPVLLQAFAIARQQGLPK